MRMSEIEILMVSLTDMLCPPYDGDGRNHPFLFLASY